VQPHFHMAAAAKRATEPAVISLHLIRSALDSADVEDAAPGELVRPPVALPQAEYLRLSFRSLLKIQNLDVLRSLKHLKLDNNGITVIEGLDCLASTLEQLDLSFNAIESMDGLDALARLTDLSLFNNRIKQVAVIDACPALQCVSLGNNLLEDLLGTVLFLRRVAPLQVLTLEGNPLCRQGEGGRDMYRPHVFAFIPKLKYLDYNFVTDADRLAAREGGVPSEKLAEVEEADAATAEALKKERARTEQLADYVAANLEVVETITGDMFSDGGEDQGALPPRSAQRVFFTFTPLPPSELLPSEWTKLKTMPSLPHQLLALRELLKPLIDELRTTGMDKDAKIREEAGQFTEAYTAVVADANAHALAAFNEWDAALASARGARQKAVAAGGGAALAAANAALEALKLRCEEVVSDVLKREMELHEMVEVRGDSGRRRHTYSAHGPRLPSFFITRASPF
jgi:hypothetical protein